MKLIHNYILIVFLGLSILIISGCNQFRSSQPIPTPDLKDRTHASLGTPITSSRYEVTVLEGRSLDSVTLPDGSSLTAKPGHLIIELGVKVKNLNTNSQATVFWQNIIVSEVVPNTQGTKGVYYPAFAGYKLVNADSIVDPKSLPYVNINNPQTKVAFNNTIYFRLIYNIPDTSPQTTVVFLFDYSGMETEVSINK